MIELTAFSLSDAETEMYRDGAVYETEYKQLCLLLSV